MRIAGLFLASVLVFGCACAYRHPVALLAETSRPAGSEKFASSRVDFDTEIKPIFEARCQPCHFRGGKVYDKMPFDRPETIKTLGTKLFTRIRDENERSLIRAFLAQQ